MSFVIVRFASVKSRSETDDYYIYVDGEVLSNAYLLFFLQHCKQPLSFLQFFDDHHEGMYAEGQVEPVGAYVAPRSCEYCGASTTTLCPASCTRPKLYFRKQKPPFASPEGWDAVTEYELPPVEEPPPPPQPTQRSSSWVSGLFGGL